MFETGKLAAALALLLGACTSNHGTFTIISNRSVDYEQLKNNSEIIRNVEGKDRAHTIIAFPTKTNPNMFGAVTDALSQHEGDAMINVSVESFFWWIPYIYGQHGWRVKGDVLKIKDK